MFLNPNQYIQGHTKIISFSLQHFISVPDQPVTDLKGTSPDPFVIDLEWTGIPEDAMNGRLLGYVIETRDAQNNFLFINTTKDGHTEFIKLSSSSHFKPDSLYLNRVCPFNSIGFGPCDVTTKRTHMSSKHFILRWNIFFPYGFCGKKRASGTSFLNNTKYCLAETGFFLSFWNFIVPQFLSCWFTKLLELNPLSSIDRDLPKIYVMFQINRLIVLIMRLEIPKLTVLYVRHFLFIKPHVITRLYKLKTFQISHSTNIFTLQSHSQ